MLALTNIPVGSLEMSACRLILIKNEQMGS